jgi:hypothetical protein
MLVSHAGLVLCVLHTALYISSLNVRFCPPCALLNNVTAEHRERVLSPSTLGHEFTFMYCFASKPKGN